MTTKVYRDEESFEGLDKSSSSAYFDEQKLPEPVATDYLGTVNTGTRRTSNVLADSITIGGSTVVIEDTAQLQQQINNMSFTGGGKIFLRKGTYIINEPIIASSPLEIEGESFENTIIDFNSTSANLSFLGTELYNTGTVTAVTSGITVTGSGTSWLSIDKPEEKQIFLGTRWYKIASVTNDTTLVLAEGYGDDVVVPAGISYRIARIKNDIRLSNLTIKSSTGDGLVFTDCRNVELEDVYVTLNLGNGVNFTNVMGISTNRLTLVANGLYGFKCTNSGYGNWVSIPSIANGYMGTGGGFYVENIKTIPWTASAADANTGNGITMKDCQDVFMILEAMGNSAIGIEQVSGNDNIVMAGGIVSGNGSDGIKLTATSDNFKIGGSNIVDNTGEGINIAAASCDNAVITGNSFSGNGGTTGGTDSGTNTVIRGNVGWDDNQSFSLIGNASVIASDTLQISADTLRQDGDDAYVLVKEIAMYWPGTVRVKFDLAESNNGTSAYARIYVNGVARGTERQATGSTYVTFSEDITVVQGDLVQLYAKDVSGGGTDFYQVKNFRLYFTKTVSTSPGVVNTD